MKICEEIFRIKSKIQWEVSQTQNRRMCKYVVGKVLRDLENQEQKIKDSKLSTEKIKRNENILEERRRLGEEFHKECMKNGYRYSEYLEISKL